VERPLDTLDLRQQKFVVGRWVGVAATGAVRRAVAGADDGDPEAIEAEERIGRELEDVTDLVQTGTIRALRDEDREEDLDAYLARLGSEVARLASPGSGSGPCVTKLVEGLDSYRAAPFDPFEVTFGIAEEVARELYEEQGFGPELPAVRCELLLDPDARRPGPEPAVTGALRTGSATSVVARLELSAAKFWREEICALTYVALHELVVHGFAAAGARAHTDAFAEGWMDFVAFGLHQRLTAGDLPQRCPFETDIHPMQQSLRASLDHAARGRGSVLIESGEVAARAAEQALVDDFGDRDRGWAAMRAFSVALNRSEVDFSRRSEMCERIVWHTDERRIMPAFVAAAKGIQAVSDPQDKIQIATEFAERTRI
jgi:hypothetical protein